MKTKDYLILIRIRLVNCLCDSLEDEKLFSELMRILKLIQKLE